MEPLSESLVFGVRSEMLGRLVAQQFGLYTKYDPHRCIEELFFEAIVGVCCAA